MVGRYGRSGAVLLSSPFLGTREKRETDDFNSVGRKALLELCRRESSLISELERSELLPMRAGRRSEASREVERRRENG